MLYISWKGSRDMRYLLLNQYTIHHHLRRLSVLQGHSPGLQELFGILEGTFLGLAELQTPEGYQLLTLSITQQTYCPYFSDCSTCTLQACMVMVMQRDCERQPASLQDEWLGHLPEKQFPDEHIHFLLSGRFSWMSPHKTMQPGPSSHRLHPLPIRTKLSCYSTLKRHYFLCSNDAHSWVTNGLQGWYDGVCQKPDPGHNPGDCIRQSPRIFNSYKHVLISCMEWTFNILDGWNWSHAEGWHEL